MQWVCVLMRQMATKKKKKDIKEKKIEPHVQSANN